MDTMVESDNYDKEEMKMYRYNRMQQLEHKISWEIARLVEISKEEETDGTKISLVVDTRLAALTAGELPTMFAELGRLHYFTA